MIRRVIAQNNNRTNRITLWLVLPDGSIRALEPRFFSEQRTHKGQDQILPFERLRSAMYRVTRLALGFDPAPEELKLLRRHLLLKTLATTKHIFVMVYQPSDPQFQPSAILRKYLIDPENPPASYTTPSHRALLRAFAAEIRERYVEESTDSVAQVNAA